MSALGLHGCPRVDLAVFADTQDEPQWVYEHLDRMRDWGCEHQLPVFVITRGHLSQDAIDRQDGKRKRFASIPAFTVGKDGREAMLRRQCTSEYKIAVIERFVRRRLGYFKKQKVKARVDALIGISLDEAHRMKDSRTPWVTNRYPLVEARLKRSDCLKIIEQQDIPLPRKSSCVFCPYHSDRYWSDLKANYPEEFERAVVFDRQVRNMSQSGIRNPIFIHRSLKPLDKVSFGENQMEFRLDEDEPRFGNECEGHCGV